MSTANDSEASAVIDNVQCHESEQTTINENRMDNHDAKAAQQSETPAEFMDCQPSEHSDNNMIRVLIDDAMEDDSTSAVRSAHDKEDLNVSDNTGNVKSSAASDSEHSHKQPVTVTDSRKASREESADSRNFNRKLTVTDSRKVNRDEPANSGNLNRKRCSDNMGDGVSDNVSTSNSDRIHYQNLAAPSKLESTFSEEVGSVTNLRNSSSQSSSSGDEYMSAEESTNKTEENPDSFQFVEATPSGDVQISEPLNTGPKKKKKKKKKKSKTGGHIGSDLQTTNTKNDSEESSAINKDDETRKINTKEDDVFETKRKDIDAEKLSDQTSASKLNYADIVKKGQNSAVINESESAGQTSNSYNFRSNAQDSSSSVHETISTDKHKEKGGFLNIGSSIKHGLKEGWKTITGKHEVKTNLTVSLQKGVPQSSIVVTFHVIIRKGILNDNNVYVVFGNPVGDWKSAMLLMKASPECKFHPDLVHLYGSFAVERKFCDKLIPYKYVLIDQKTNKEQWEQFHEDEHGDNLNRYIKILPMQKNHFNKYDDCITVRKRDSYAHTSGREYAYSVFSLDALLFDFKRLDDIVEDLHAIYSSLCNQKLIDKKEQLQIFGRHYRPDDAVRELLKHCSSQLGESNVKSFCMAIILTILLNGNDFADSTILRKLFETYKLIIISFDQNPDLRQQISLSADMQSKLADSVVNLINKYIYIIDRHVHLPAYPCVYAFALVRLLDHSEQCIGKIKLLFFKRCLTNTQKKDLCEVLKVIGKLPDCSLSFKYEYLELCSPELFLELISSSDLQRFPPTLIFKRLCCLFAEKSLSIYKLRSMLKSLGDYFLATIPCLDNDAIYSWQENVNKCLSDDVIHDVEMLRFFLQILISLRKSIDAEKIPELYCQNAELFQTLTKITIKTLISVTKLKNYFEIAQCWSEYLNIFSSVQDKSYYENLLSAFKEQVSKWNPSRCEREVISKLQDDTNLNDTVLDIILDLIFNDKSSTHSKESNWSYYLDKVGIETTTTAKRHKGTILNRLILAFPFHPQPNEKLSFQMFLQTTESDNLCKILKHMKDYQQYISDKASDHLISILANLDFFIKLVEGGDLSFRVLENLSNNDRINRLVEIFRLSGKNIRRLIEFRLEEYEYALKNIRSIQRFYQYIQGNTKANLCIESVIKFDENNSILKDCCIIRKFDSTSAPKFVVKDLDVANIDLMSNFVEYLESRCFLQMLRDRIQQTSTETWTLDDALNFARSTINSFLEFCRKLSNKSLLLCEVNKYFSNNYADVTKLKTDLDIISRFIKIGEDWIDNVLKKIQLFFSVRDMTKMAECMKETIEVLNVECDSSSIDKILELSGDSDEWLSNELNYLSDDMLAYKDMFSTWNVDLLSAMKTFNKCANLIEWVRGNIENAQELKVFIDLANISAGESDIEVDRVLCFQSAVMAYSGLLFDCQGECSLDQLFQACNTLNNALERDGSISNKLLDSNRHTRWLESIKDRHGSVETSSVNLVNLISRNGEINIKTSASTSSSFVDVNISFEEFHENERYKQKLNLDALKELESKLMLISVSPEIKCQVDRFISVLHQIVLVSKSLEELLIGGCRLFSQLSITGYFNCEKEVSLRLDFGHKTGILSGCGSLEEELSSVITCLSSCVTEWNDYIMKMRTDCHLLNYYTTDQLVTLSRFVANIEFGRDFNKEEFVMMLRLIADDIDMESVKVAIKSPPTSSSKLNEDETVNNFEIIQESVTVDDKESKSEFDMDKVKEIVESISESFGYEEENILACILQTGNVTDINEIVDWCLEHDQERATYNDFNVKDNEIDPVTVDAGEMSDDVSSEKEKFSIIQDLISKISSDYDIEQENVFAAIIETENMEDEEMLAEWCYDNPDYKVKISIDRIRRERFFMGGVDNEEKDDVEENVIDSSDIVIEINEPSPSGDISVEISKMWSMFLTSTNITDAEDFVSFKRLGEILQSLYSKFSKPLNRQFPPYLEEGKPNLIVVKESTIHQTALMLYQIDDEKDLPSLDEVLICDSDTTREQLVLHCLRSFHDESGKIYTFLNADRINFDNSCHLEKLFLTPVTNHGYRLVFLSSKEHDDHSYMGNALLRYRVNMPKLTDMKDSRTYLHRHLMRQNEQSVGWRVDPGKSRFRVISSARSGEGKTLVSHRMSEQGGCSRVTLSVHTDKVDNHDIVECLFQRSLNRSSPQIYHIDLLSNVREGVQDLLFSLSVVGGIRDFKGRFWKCCSCDYHAVEMVMNPDDTKCQELFESLLPVIWCKSPRESLQFYQDNNSISETVRFHVTPSGLCHYIEYKTCTGQECQRPYQYLEQFYRGNPLDQFIYKEKQGSLVGCVDVLLRACCVQNPTWMELSNFWKFLNVQLVSCEKSVFCNVKFVGDTLPGFKNFVVNFLIQMSKDFSTRSAIVTDESMTVPEIPDRNRWENSFHPYLFFNEDGHSLCFFGFKIRNGHLIDDRDAMNERIIAQNVMRKDLFEGLRHQGIDFNRNLHQMSQQKLRLFYLEELRKVFGLSEACECDGGYELTSDNVLKMLAIHMRFRADIPVMIMGETGTGKTRLIRFICDLQKQGQEAENMVIVKCHGGIESKHIYESVKRTIDLAKKNTKAGIPQTVLFFDEANTTNAIGAIKEVMCDKMVNGERIPDNVGIKFVAAVNPYREHSQEMIRKLENAGLGYHMKAENTEDKLAGKIPMRRLVYRVKELSPSILPLIWDFGKLDDITEEKYIMQMVENRIVRKDWLTTYQNMLVSVLTTCQRIMRARKDECSFVSLRDVDRCLEILGWFVIKGQLITDPIQNDPNVSRHDLPDDFIVQLILAIACSYYVRLEDRRDFFNQIQTAFTRTGLDIINEMLFHDIISACQNLFINELRLEATISRNEALKENVWIMAICIELKIPLFLVGKPGSSKSLAKTLVGDVMQGEASYSPLFKRFKEIQLVSFQCSPLATADGILSTFRQCQTYQKKQSLDSFTSVVVLDEIGLAEDSPKMPLKTLHPLLEDGCVGDEMPEAYKKVGFIGISNWALDPAKMNRGIFVSRGKLSRNDLLKTARGICFDDEEMKRHLEEYLNDIVDAYLYIYETQEREYYGLRDFYSLIKMLYQFYRAGGEITVPNVKKAVYRCFGGYFGEMQPAEEFISRIKAIPIDIRNGRDIRHFDLIKYAMTESEENRYLLLLTKNNAALRILLENKNELFQEKVSLIFGSSFPHDQEYMQLCKSINRIKLAMEMGHTVILCNLTNLYESLYDALNQSYVYMGGSRYVDLGLGMHRVKCRVHRSFRLIVVAEDSDVFERFPIPLINRLEKHYLGMESLMVPELEDEAHALEQWIARFAEIKPGDYLMKNDFVQYTPEDVFMGFHKDVTASLILQSREDCLEYAKRKLINCASPDSISRLESSNLSESEIEEVTNIYHLEQQHTSLAASINSLKDVKQIFLQITTHSRLLTISSKDNIATHMSMEKENINLISLHQIETEGQFRKRLEEFFIGCCENIVKNVVIIQCSFDNRIQRSNLVECARCCIKEVSDHFPNKLFAVVLLIQIPRIKGGRFIGFPPNPWHCAHLDEIHSDHLPFDIYNLKGKTVRQVFEMLNEEIFCRLLLEACPKSCSKIEPIDDKRIVERIKIVSQSLRHRDLRGRLLESVKKTLLRCEEKAEYQNLRRDDLLVKVSMESIYLREGHTFQQSLWLTLLNRIVPPLTNIVKCCDLGQGLDHLANGCDWIKDFYLKILDKLDIENQTPSELACQYDCSLPFSWFIFDLCGRIYSTSQTSHSDTFYCALKETAVGHVLTDLFQTNNEEASKLFVRDLLLMRHTVLKSDEDLVNILIEQIIDVAQNEIVVERIEGLCHAEIQCEETLTAADLYLAFEKKQNCLRVLCEALSFYEKCFGKSITVTKFTGSRDLLKIDRFVIEKILDALEPKGIDLIDPSIRNGWMKNVKQFQIIMQKYLSYQSETDTKLIEKYRRLEILSLFAEYVIGGQSNEKFSKKLKQSLNQLGLILMKSCDPRTSVTFKQLVTILSRISVDTAKLIFCGGVEKCFICMEQIKEPVALPCGHVACLECLEEIVTNRLSSSTDGKWNCPFTGCQSIYSSELHLESSLECKEAVEEHRLFRENMNVFFLEILQRFIFSSNSTPDEEVLKCLLEYVITTELPRHNHATRKLSPFRGDCVDPTPTIRSFIFQQILRGDWERIDEYFNSFYSSVSSVVESSTDVKTEFCLLLLYSIEDSLLSREIVVHSDSGTELDRKCHFISDIIDSISMENVKSMTFLQKLQLAAKLRICLCYAAELIHRMTSQRENLSEFEMIQLERIEELVKTIDEECLFKYLVKEMGNKFSRGSILEWKNQAKFLDMLHPLLRETDFNYQPDYHNVIGNDYQQLKHQLSLYLNNQTSENVEFRLPQNSKMMMNLRLVSFYFKSKFDVSKPLDEKNNERLCEIENRLGSSLNQLAVTDPIVQRVRSDISAIDKTLYSLMIHFHEMLVLHQSSISGVIHFFYCLCFHPNRLNGCFFPSMHQDELADILNLMYKPNQDHVTNLQHFKRVYKCRCGYMYAVANCGQLNERGKCPECKSLIGGSSSSQVVQLSPTHDTSQTGHILGPAVNNQMITGVRELNSVQVAVLRFLMHASMFLSHDKSALSALVVPQVSVNELDSFLMHHLRHNFTQISRTVGKSEDHARIYLHLIIDNFTKYNSNVPVLPLNTKDDRMKWEVQFAQNLSDTTNLDSIYENFQNQMKVELEGQQSIFQKILDDKNSSTDFVIDNLPFVDDLWQPRVRISLANINQKVGREEMAAKCPLLSLMIENEFELSLMQHLVSILKLQSSLVRKFNRKLDISDLENKSIREFLQTFVDDSRERDSLKRLIDVYLDVFNRLRHKLFNFSHTGRLAFEHYKSVDASCGAASIEGSRCGILFPSELGFGLCAVGLVQLLMERHNSVVKSYLSRFGGDESGVPPCIVDQSQLVAFEHHQLEMLLLVNSHYSLQSDRATEWSIDLDNLERQVENRFFIGRVVLDKQAAPQFQFPDDDHSSKKLQLHIPQAPLPPSIQHLIESYIASLPDLCLFLNHCQTLRNLLAITVTPSSSDKNVNAKSSLRSYVTMVQFRMTPHLFVSRLLDNILLEHMDDLIVFLKVVRAKRMILLKQNPWQGVLAQTMQSDVDSELKEKLNEVLHHIPPSVLLSRLYRFIEEYILSGHIDNPEFSIPDCIYEFLFELDDPHIDTFQNYFPDSALIKHCASCFAYFVEQLDTQNN